MTSEVRLRLIKKKEVCQLTSYSPAHIDRLEAAGLFPRRIQLGQARVAWLEHEVLDWIATKAKVRQVLKLPVD
jgi:prophage regulatory protein